MRRARSITVVLLMACTIVGAAEQRDEFISEFEYGQMLYQNPRGVSCAPCHGDRAEGKEIARYKNTNGRTIVLSGPDIRGASLEKIMQTVKKGPGVMPRYFFTDEEIRAIYSYIHNLAREEKEEE